MEQVDNFKEAICKSLSDYNEQIETLKTEMADATQIADALRCAALIILCPCTPFFAVLV